MIGGDDVYPLPARPEFAPGLLVPEGGIHPGSGLVRVEGLAREEEVVRRHLHRAACGPDRGGGAEVAEVEPQPCRGEAGDRFHRPCLPLAGAGAVVVGERRRCPAADLLGVDGRDPPEGMDAVKHPPERLRIEPLAVTRRSGEGLPERHRAGIPHPLKIRPRHDARVHREPAYGLFPSLADPRPEEFGRGQGGDGVRLVDDDRHPAGDGAHGARPPVFLLGLHPTPHMDVHIDRARKAGEPGAVDRLIGTHRRADMPDDAVGNDDIGAPPRREQYVPEHQIGGHRRHASRSSRVTWRTATMYAGW